jgi:hypothetical protein
MLSIELLLEVMEHQANDGDELTLPPGTLRALIGYIRELQKNARLHPTIEAIRRDIGYSA